MSNSLQITTRLPHCGSDAGGKVSKNRKKTGSQKLSRSPPVTHKKIKHPMAERYAPYPSGFFFCQFQLSRTMSEMVLFVFQPSSRRAFDASA